MALPGQDSPWWSRTGTSRYKRQYEPTELVELLPHIKECGMVNGYKIRRGDAWSRVVIGRLYHRTAKRLFGLVVQDVDCDFRLIRRDALTAIHLTSRRGSICVELVRKIQDAECCCGCGMSWSSRRWLAEA